MGLFASVRKETGALGWLYALAAMVGPIFLLGFLPFSYPLLLLTFPVLAPALVLAPIGAILAWRGPIGVIQGKGRAAALWLIVWMEGLLVYVFGWHSYLVYLDPLLAVLVLGGLAERAHAYGRTGWREALLGAIGAYVAAVTFVLAPSSGWLAAVVCGVAVAVVVGLQLLPLRVGTRVAIGIGFFIILGQLDLALSDWALRLAQVGALSAYAVGLWMVYPRLPLLQFPLLPTRQTPISRGVTSK